MSVTTQELQSIVQQLITTHGTHAYGLAATAHMACGLLRNVQRVNGINMDAHVALTERAFHAYGEKLGVDPSAIDAARIDIERSGQTVSILNTL